MTPKLQCRPAHFLVGVVLHEKGGGCPFRSLFHWIDRITCMVHLLQSAKSTPCFKAGALKVEGLKRVREKGRRIDKDLMG